MLMSRSTSLLSARGGARGLPAIGGGRRNLRSSVKARAEVTNDIGALGLRLTASSLMVHNGLDKLADPEGFAKFVVEPYLHLPEPVLLTYLAAGAEIACPVLLVLGFLTRPAALALLGTMGAAVYFHIQQSGLEGFPLAVVENHAYAYETAALYFAIFLYLLVAGPGRFSIDGK